MDQCSVEVAEYAEKILLYSGRSPFFKGNYEQCLDNSALKYALVQFGIGGVDSGAFMGVCVPRTCNDSQVSFGLDSVLGWMNSTFSVYSIDSHIVDYHIKMDWLSYITISILAGIVILTIWGTFRHYFNKESKKQVVLDAFDVGKNMAHFQVRQGEDLNIMDGVRAIAMMWVVFGHSFSFSLASGIVNIQTITPMISRPFMLLVEAGLLSVDMFFMLSGFFLAFAFMREKASGVGAFAMGVLQRLLRIWPAYILAMMFYYSLFMQTGSGIFWSKAWIDVSMCRSMWREVLFVANMIDRGKEMCLGWGWYLQVDFQLFLFSLLLLFLYRRSKFAMGLISLACMIASTIFNVVYTYDHEVRIFTDLGAFVNFEDFMLDLYEKPWGRCTPYLMGLVLGIYFMEYRKAKKENCIQGTYLGKFYNVCKDNRVRVCVEWIGIGLMAFVAFIPRCLQTGECTWSQLTHAFYWGLSKPIFLIGMTMTILPTMLGHRHSFFNMLLTCSTFHFIARISFCTYLVHLMVMYNFVLSRNYNIYYNIIDNFMAYLGILVLCLIFGFITTVLIELPFAKLQKEVLARLKAKAISKKQLHDSLITNEESVLKEKESG